MESFFMAGECAVSLLPSRASFTAPQLRPFKLETYIFSGPPDRDAEIPLPAVRPGLGDRHTAQARVQHGGSSREDIERRGHGVMRSCWGPNPLSDRVFPDGGPAERIDPLAPISSGWQYRSLLSLRISIPAGSDRARMRWAQQRDEVAEIGRETTLDIKTINLQTLSKIVLFLPLCDGSRVPTSQFPHCCLGSTLRFATDVIRFSKKW